MSEGFAQRGLAGLREGLADLTNRFFRPDPPLVAVEFRPRSVSVVRGVRSGAGMNVEAAASMELPPGTLEISMTADNVREPDVLVRATGAALERAGAMAGGPVALVLPDPVARVSLLPPGEVAARGRAELQQMLQFRMKKTVPFDVQEARLGASFPRGDDEQVVAAAIARPVLEGYERSLVTLGYEPGQVEIGCLALADAAGQEDGDTALVNWDHGYLSLVILRDGWPILVRTLVGDFTGTPEPVIREANNTILYYRERLGGMGLESAVVRSALLRTEEAIAILREPLGVLPMVFDPWAGHGPAGSLAAGQALAGAAAALLRGTAA